MWHLLICGSYSTSVYMYMYLSLGTLITERLCKIDSSYGAMTAVSLVNLVFNATKYSVNLSCPSLTITLDRYPNLREFSAV